MSQNKDIQTTKINHLTWYIYWRYLLLSLLAPIAAGIIGIFIGLACWALGVDIDAMKIPNIIIGGIIGLVTTFYILKFLLRRAITKQIQGITFQSI